MEEVTRCRYIGCVESIARGKEQILHEVPVDDTKLSVKWLINSGNVEFVAEDLDALCSKKFFICNNHFTDDCYLSKGTLKENAVPTPHWSPTSRMIRASRMRRKIRLNGDQHGEIAAANKLDKIPKLLERNGSVEFEADQWCRTCARKKLELISMNDKQKGTEMSLLSKLKLLIEIDDEDALPIKMCSECVLKLEQCFKFFQQIYIADNTLRQLFPKRHVNGMDSVRENECMPIEQRVEIHRETRISPERIEPVMDFKPTQNVYRGGPVRRGRGRPRSRGSIARTRARLRPRQVNTPFNPHPVPASTLIAQSESDGIKMPHEQEKRVDTVFSLLTDTCHSDEELDWSDVLKLMNRTTRPQPPKTPIKETLSENPNSEKGIHCEFCNDIFKFRRQLRSHLLTDHTDLARYMCPDCVACYGTETLLEKHRAVHHGDRRYRCDHCFKEFLEKRMLREHVIACQPPPETKSETKPETQLCNNSTCYSCDSCGEFFPSKSGLAEHVKTHETSITSSPLPSSFNTEIGRDSLSKLLHSPGSDQRDDLKCSTSSFLNDTNVIADTHIKTDTRTESSNADVGEKVKNSVANSVNDSMHEDVQMDQCADLNAQMSIQKDLTMSVDVNVDVNTNTNVNDNVNADVNVDKSMTAETKVDFTDNVETDDKKMNVSDAKLNLEDGKSSIENPLSVETVSQAGDKTIENVDESNTQTTESDSAKRKDLSSHKSLSSNEEDEHEYVEDSCKRPRVSSR